MPNFRPDTLRPLPAVNINNYESCSQCDTHAGSFRVLPWPGQPWNLPPCSHFPWVPVVDIHSTNYHRMGKQHAFWHNFRDREVRVSMAGMRQAPTLVSLLEQQPFLRGLHFHILIPIKGLIYQKKKSHWGFRFWKMNYGKSWKLIGYNTRSIFYNVGIRLGLTKKILKYHKCLLQKQCFIPNISWIAPVQMLRAFHLF